MQKIRFSEYAETFAAERDATLRKCSMIGMRAVATIIVDGSPQMWDLGKLLFGKFTPEEPTLRVS